jgi:hypothetical protein
VLFRSGQFAEADEIVRVLKDPPPGVQVVAYVRKAWAAGAILALACPQIVMAPEGTLGASPFSNLLPPAPAPPAPAPAPGVAAPAGQSPAAQFQAAFEVEQALLVEKNHRDPLLASGMWDAQRELVLVTEAGAPKVVEATDARAAGGKVVKAKGKLLLLAAREAKETGLSLGTALNEDAIREVLGLPAWRKAGSAAALMALKAKEGRTKAYLDSIAPQLKKLDEELAQVQAAGRAAEQALADIQRLREQERNRVLSDYRMLAGANAGNNLQASQAYVNFIGAKQNEVDARYAPKIAEATAAVNRLALEQRRLLGERKALLDAAPK